MAIQTGQLSESMPNFAANFRVADAKGSSDWEVIQWEGIDPTVVTPDQVTRPINLIDDEETRPNRFASRTQALVYSKLHVQRLHPHARERGHWGVWTWVQDGSTRYQSVAPVQKYKSIAAGRQSIENTTQSRDPHSDALKMRNVPGVVREPKPDISNAMVRVSPETNRRLREIVAADNTTLQSVIDAAVKEYYRAWFFRRADAAYEALRRDETAWAQEMAERKSWDATLLDGIDCNERWREDGTLDEISSRAGRHG